MQIRKRFNIQAPDEVVNVSGLKKNNNQNNDNSRMPKGCLKYRIDPAVIVIFCALLFDLLAFTIILPLLPSLLEYFSYNDSSGLYNWLTECVVTFQDTLGIPERYNTVLFGGLIGSMFSFLQFLASPIVGGISDIYGRKPVILMCTIGTATSYFLWARSRDFSMFVFSRFIGGLSKGNISLSMSVITDVCSESNRNKGMAFVGVAFSLGFIIGPIIGAKFTKMNKEHSEPWFIYPALLACALAICGFIVLRIFLKETLPKERRARKLYSSLWDAWNLLNVISIFRFAIIKNIPRKQMDTLRKIGLVYFMYLFLYSALEFTVTFLMYHHFDYTIMDQAKMFFINGVIMTLIQAGYVRRLRSDQVKNHAYFSLILLTPAFTLVGLANRTWILNVGMILYAISTAFTVTCLTTLISKYGNSNQKGSVLGIFRSLGALARALGPIVGSLAFWWIGSKLTYIIGGVFLLIPACILHSTQI